MTTVQNPVHMTKTLCVCYDFSNVNESVVSNGRQVMECLIQKS